jgi:hypothetical protein
MPVMTGPIVAGQSIGTPCFVGGRTGFVLSNLALVSAVAECLYQQMDWHWRICHRRDSLVQNIFCEALWQLVRCLVATLSPKRSLVATLSPK